MTGVVDKNFAWYIQGITIQKLFHLFKLKIIFSIINYVFKIRLLCFLNSQENILLWKLKKNKCFEK